MMEIKTTDEIVVMGKEIILDELNYKKIDIISFDEYRKKKWVSVDSLIEKLIKIPKHKIEYNEKEEYLGSEFILAKHIEDIIKELKREE